MKAVTNFTPSSQLRRVAAFGGTFNGNGHEGLLDVEPGMTWDDVFFKQSDDTALLGFMVYDNVASRHRVADLVGQRARGRRRSAS